MFLALLILLSVSIPSNASQDDGFGICPSFSHYHANWNDLTEAQKSFFIENKTDKSIFDGKCHRDDDDSVIDDKTRKVLPKPNSKWKWL